MSEFFKQLVIQFTALWNKLSLQQKIITTALVVFTLFGLVMLLVFAGPSGDRGDGSSGSGGMRVLYSDLDLEEATMIVDELNKGGYKHKLENNGRNILVNQKQIYEIRMALAREGLPRKRGLGYELFDKTSLGMTDQVQKLNAKRALEGELQRTIEDLEEVKSVRVHITLPEHTIFLDNQRDAKASVTVHPALGRELTKDQIRGITHLVASSVDGLKPSNVTIHGPNGKLLSSPFADDDLGMVSSRNQELKHNMERYLRNKVDQMMGKMYWKTPYAVDLDVLLDFDQVEKTIETFDPEGRVVRSEERQDENTKNAPDGDHQRERSLTNYEINRTFQKVAEEVGNIKRLTLMVRIDGTFERNEEGRRVFVERSEDELRKIEDAVKNTVGYDLARGDEITVACIRFDRDEDEDDETRSRREQEERMWFWIKLAIAVVVGIIILLILRSIAKSVTEAMNPPVPVLEELGLEEIIEEEEVNPDAQRAQALLEKVELLTNQAPMNIAAIIRQWLLDGVAEKPKK